MNSIFRNLTLMAMVLCNCPISRAVTTDQETTPMPEKFDAKQAPSAADWQYFTRMPAVEREQLWNESVKTGNGLGQWSWQWRLGWIRSCEVQLWNQCALILKQALSDNAAVVRSTAAVTAGRIYSQTQDSAITQLLLGAARDPRNFRGGKPLFVTKRILFSLYRIGNAEGLKAAAKLVAVDQDLQSYWDKLPKS